MREAVAQRIRVLIPALLTLVVGGAGIGCLMAWRRDLPDPVATHWSGRTPNGFTSVIGMLWTYAVITAVGVLLCLVTLIRAVPSIAQRLLAGIGCGTAAFVLILMTFVAGSQRGVADAAGEHMPFWVIAPSLIAGLLLGAAAAWSVPSRPTGRSFDPVGSVPAGDDPPPLPARWCGGGVEVRLDSSGVVFRGLWGLVRITVPLDRVVRAEVVPVDPFRDFGGWGYRVASFGKLKGAKGFVWRGGDALLVVYSDDGGPDSQRREIAVLRDAAPVAAAAINATTRGRGRPPHRAA